MSLETMKENNLEKVRQINEVPGFNAECYAIPYTDMNTGEVRRRLPFMPLLAWFRLKYPEGKIASSVTKENDCFVGTARIYCSYKDTPEQYIAEATVSRTYCDDKPSVSPREWAQTAAISMALRNAGFGLQFDMVSDDYSATAPQELGVAAEPKKDAPKSNSGETIVNSGDLDAALSAVEDAISIRSADSGNSSEAPPIKEPTLEEKYAAACKLPCPIGKYEGRTLGELIAIDPKAITWVAEKYQGDPEIKAAALVICEYSLMQAG